MAAIAVLIYHYVYRYNELYGHPSIWVPWQTVYGLHGITLFFMISGFVIYMSLRGKPSIKRFAWSRFCRLYPAYWLALLLTLCAVWTLGLPGREISPGQALLNVSMLQSWLGVPHADGVYWTLGIELSFYLWIGLLLALRALKSIVLLGNLWLGVTVLLSLSGVVDSGALNQTLLLNFWPYFFAGILFYRAHEEGLNRWKALSLGACLGAIWLTMPLDTALIASGFFVVFAGMLAGWLKPLGHPLLRWLGGISYCLYLIHQNVGYIAIRELKDMGVHAYWAIFWAGAIALALAAAMTYGFERPVARALKRRSSTDK